MASVMPALRASTTPQLWVLGTDDLDAPSAETARRIKSLIVDGKDFTLYFDKETGLPVKQVAQVRGFMGDEFTQETTFADYKDFGGIKKATKIESKRDGQRFIEQEVTEFKTLDKVDPATFEEPK